MYTNSPRCCDCNTTTSLSQILLPNSTFRGVVGGADMWLVVVAFGAGYRNRTDDIFFTREVLYLTELNRRGLSEAVICGIVLQSQEQRYLHRAPSVAVETDSIAALTSP